MSFFSPSPSKLAGFNRRSFLKRAGIISLTGLTLPSWMPRMAFAEDPGSASGDILVCLFLRGAMDGLSAVVPFNEANYYDSRPTIQVPDTSVLNLDGQFGLHPVMSPIHGIWQEGDLAIIHACGSPDDTRSHFDAMDYMERGTPGEKLVQSGWIGRHLMSMASQNDSPFRAIGMGASLQTSLRGAVPAVALKSIADFHLRGRQSELTQIQQTLESLYDVGQDAGAEMIQLESNADATFDALRLLETANPTQYLPQHGAVYPDNSLGYALGQIAQLIRADVGLEIACVDAGGWDTHETMGTYDAGVMRDLLGGLALAIGAFYTDMQDEMPNITFVVMSEFGRRIEENGSLGTDHGHGNCMFVVGGGINGGQVYGNWPGLAPQNLYRGDLAVTTDFRDILAEIVQRRLGNSSLDQVFPDYSPAFLNFTQQADGRNAVRTRRFALPEQLTQRVYLPAIGNGAAGAEAEMDDMPSNDMPFEPDIFQQW